MKNQVVVNNRHYSKYNAVTYVRDSSGIIATFPYNPNDYASITQRLMDFNRFSIIREIEVIEVLGDLVI